MHMLSVLQKAIGMPSPGAGVTSSCELASMVMGTELGASASAAYALASNRLSRPSGSLQIPEGRVDTLGLSRSHRCAAIKSMCEVQEAPA